MSTVLIVRARSWNKGKMFLHNPFLIEGGLGLGDKLRRIIWRSCTQTNRSLRDTPHANEHHVLYNTKPGYCSNIFISCSHGLQRGTSLTEALGIVYACLEKRWYEDDLLHRSDENKGIFLDGYAPREEPNVHVSHVCSPPDSDPRSLPWPV